MEQLLHWTIRRMRAIQALHVAVRVSMFSVPVSVAGHFALRLWATAVPAWPAIALGVLLPVAAACRSYFSFKPTKLQAAVAIDRAAACNEAASTAIAFSGKDISEELAEALSKQAISATSNLKIQTLKSHLPLKDSAFIALATMLLLAGLYVGFELPVLNTTVLGQDKLTPEDLKKEAQKVREVARKTDADLAKLQKLAELRKMDALRRAAMQARKKMDQLTKQSTSKRDAMIEFSKLADNAPLERKNLLGNDKEVRFGKSEEMDALSKLASELDRIDPKGLDFDLEEFQKQLHDEATSAKTEGREPVVDQRKLEELIRRTKEAQKALEELEKRMQENPALRQQLQQMSDKQRELLEKINKQLERLKST